MSRGTLLHPSWRKTSSRNARKSHWLGRSNTSAADRYLQPRLEMLEVRTMLSVAPLYYSATGAGNNLANPNWGAAGQPLLRSLLGSNYVDGISSMAGQIDPTTGQVNSTLPSARLVSNLLGNQTGDVLDNRDLSAFTYAWGQFIDHDLDLTPDGGTSVPIPVPTGDTTFDPTSQGGQTLPFTRSETAAGTGTSTSNPLNQVTVVTSFLDGSQVYGSDPARADALRTHVGGQLKVSAGDLLPLNTTGLDNANNGPYPNSDMFVAGDIRANENIELTSLQVLFMREHNRQAAILQAQHPTWTDEQLYQGARQIVIAEIQSITFNEYLPALLGTSAIPKYTGYDPSVNPGITPEFSEAAFRFGHSQLDDDVQFLKNNGQNFSFTFTLPDGTTVPINTASDVASDETGMSLVDAFFDPYAIEQPGVVGSILKYLASDNSQAIDTQMVDSVRNILFGAPGSGAGGQDLFALDVQRGRDVGLPTYNAARVAYGLPAVTSFTQITSDPTLQADLEQLYGNDVNKVELFVGGLAEDHAPGSSVGPTFQAIIANQFERIRDGDRLWYQNIFSGADLKAIQNVTLADIISRNTNITNLQSNVFFFDASVSGHVFVDGNGNGHFGIGDQPLPGVVVQLIDSSGAVVNSTTTGRDGSYSFDNLELGKYTVKASVPRTAAAQQSGTITQQVQVTNGGSLTADLAVAPKQQHPGQTGFRDALAALLRALGAWLQSAFNQLQNNASGNGPFGHGP